MKCQDLKNSRMTWIVLSDFPCVPSVLEYIALFPSCKSYVCCTFLQQRIAFLQFLSSFCLHSSCMTVFKSYHVYGAFVILILRRPVAGYPNCTNPNRHPHAQQHLQYIQQPLNLIPSNIPGKNEEFAFPNNVFLRQIVKKVIQKKLRPSLKHMNTLDQLLCFLDIELEIAESFRSSLHSLQKLARVVAKYTPVHLD